MGSGPTGRRIGRRDELGRDLGRRAESSVVEHSQILLNGSACGFRRQPFFALDALLPVGFRLDEAGINRKAFAADQALFNAALQDRLKDAPQEIALAETAMPVLREGGMIGNIAVEPEPAEPPVRQIEVDLFAERRSERIPKQYPTMSIRIISSGSIDWATHRAIEWC